MLLVKFDPYEERDPKARSLQLWVLLWHALYNPKWSASSDKTLLHSTVRLLDAFDSVTEKTDSSARLKPEGGEMLLESSEFKLLQDAWEAFFPLLPRSAAREIMMVSEFLAAVKPVEVEVKR